MNNRGIFRQCIFASLEEILANVKISRLSAFSSWLCDLFPSLQADNTYLMAPLKTDNFNDLGENGMSNRKIKIMMWQKGAHEKW